MAVARGIDLRAAVAVGSTWGTIASDPTTDALQPLISSTVKESRELIVNDELRDVQMRGAATGGNRMVEGTWTKHLHYQGDEIPHAAFFGTYAPTQVGTTAYYTNRATSKSSLQGVFLSLFEDRETSTWEVDSAKVNQLTVSGSIGQRVQVAYDFMGRALDTAGDITWGSVTQNAASKDNHVLMSHLAWYVNDESGGSVTSETAIGIDSFSVTFNNNLSAYRANSDYIAEPTRDGFYEVTGSITLPTYENNTHVADILDKSLRKMAFVFTSGSYSYSIFIPGFRWDGDLPEVGGPGRVPQTLNFVAEAVDSAGTGMNSTMPYVEIVSQDSTDHV